MAVKSKNKKTKGKTLNDLKSWLDGFCSAHGKDWSPDAEQWNMIKDMIMDVIETDNTQYNRNTQIPQQRIQPQYNGNPQQYTVPQQEHTAPLAASLTPTAPKPQVVKGADGKPTFKTPSVDTSDGTYESGFG